VRREEGGGGRRAEKGHSAMDTAGEIVAATWSGRRFLAVPVECHVAHAPLVARVRQRLVGSLQPRGLHPHHARQHAPPRQEGV